MGSRTPRPWSPTFIQEQSIEAQDQQCQDDDITTCFREYQALGKELHAIVSFRDFCIIKHPEWYEEEEYSFRDTRKNLGRVAYQSQEKKHAVRHTESVCIEEDRTTTLNAPLETSHEYYDNITHVRQIDSTHDGSF